MNTQLRTAALNLRARAEAQLGQQRLTNTRRRAEQASMIERRAQREVERAQLALRIAEGDGGPSLARVRTVAMLQLLEGVYINAQHKAAFALQKRPDDVEDDEVVKFVRLPRHDEDQVRKLARAGLGDEGELREAVRSMLALRVPAPPPDPVKALERELVGARIPGYFPTPKLTAGRMVVLAGIRPGMHVVEPEAGSGHIAVEIRAAGVEPLCIEVNHTLANILRAKSFTVQNTNFLEWFSRKPIDAICMNPPFEKGQDIEHVAHAMEQLANGGTLVAIMSNGPFFRDDLLSLGFRTWFESRGTTQYANLRDRFELLHEEELPPGTFNHSDVTQRTNVSARLIALRKL